MRPLFTIHAGEYLVASYIEQRFKNVNVWIPSRDTGIDLLITDRRSRTSVSLQVKFSKDFLFTHMRPIFQKHLRACGWWTINREKLRDSPADFWIFVLLGFRKGTADFVIVPTRTLRERMRSIHGSQRTIQSYLWVSERERCWETRGLSPKRQLQVAEAQFTEPHRDFTKWLNNWAPVNRLNR